MTTPDHHDVWASSTAYEAYMGRWSRQLAREFVSWLSVPPGVPWLDVGCGTGALAQAILELASPQEVVGIDPSEGYIEHAGNHITGTSARFQVADVQALPFAGAEFGAVAGSLMLNFVPDPAKAVSEMTRVAKPGGTVAACVWDYAGEMQMIRRFWDAAIALDDAARELDEGRRFPLCKPKPLQELFQSAGLRDVSVLPIEIRAHFQNFDDYWNPFLGGQGPAPSYAVRLTEDSRSALRERLAASLPSAPDGSIDLIARAWAIRGTV
ncbi:MAG TPA: class I SAM-dependent methyltransferase [Dehalococcoidia bacterium]|nr:class I SAM-dependent methyltransferase [Dehalococcoidia bacterium]